MLTSLYSSLLAKFSAAALLLLGVTGGLAATGSLPVLSFSAAPAAISGVPSTPDARVNLDFPTSVLHQQAAATAAPAEQVVEEVVVVPAARAVAAARPVVAAAPAAPAAPQCVADVTGVVNAVLAILPAVTTPEQGQMLLGQVGALTNAANACVAEAQKVGFAGVDQLLGQVSSTVAQVQALPVVAGLSPEQVAQAPNLVGGIVGGVGQVVGGSLNVVGKGLNLLTGGLNTGLNFLLKPNTN